MAGLASVPSVPGRLHRLVDHPDLRVGKSLKVSADPESTHTWMPVPDGGGRTFEVRKGPNYAENKEKAPSKDALYECVAVDFFHSAKKRFNVAERTRLPSDGGAEEEKVLGMPANIVVTMNMPNYGPPNPVWGKAKDDGDGYVMVVYLVVSARTRRLLLGEEEDDSEASASASASQSASGADGAAPHVPPSVDLLRRFVYAAADDPVRQRFKGIARVVNLPEVPLNGLAKKLVNSYNATPFLLRTTSSFYKGTNYFEVCVDVHRFSYLALVGLNGIKDKISSVIADLGFVIQAEEDHEQPEQVLGCVRLRKLTLKEAPDYPE